MLNKRSSFILAPALLVLAAMFGLGCSGDDSTTNPLDPDCCPDRPMLFSITPNRIAFGDTGVVITLDGANYSENSVALWNDIPLPTTYIGYNLEARLRDEYLVRPDSSEVETVMVEVKVWNETEGLPVSNSMHILISDPADPPVITHMEPDTFTVNTASAYIFVYGTGFDRSGQLNWGDQVWPGNMINENLFRATVRDSAFAQVGPVSVSVSNSLGLIPSNSLTAMVANPQPVLDEYSPPHFLLGDGDQSMRFIGSGFSNETIVLWNGHECETTILSSTLMFALLDEEDIGIAEPGILSIQNPEPGGGQIEPLVLPIYQFINESSNDMIYDPLRNVIYLARNDEFVTMDPATGNILSTNPNAPAYCDLMALTDDGSYLYLGNRTSFEITRVSLSGGGQTLDITVPERLGKILTLPGAPESIAVSIYDYGNDPEFPIYIFDDDVMRPERGPTDGETYFYCYSNIVRTSDPNVIVAGAGEYFPSTGPEYRGMKHIQLTPDGARVNDLSYEGIMDENFVTLTYHDGLIYSRSGLVVDAATFETVHRFETFGQILVDGDASQIYQLTLLEDSRVLRVFSLDTWEPLMEFPVAFYFNYSKMIKAGPDLIIIEKDDGLVFIRSPLFTGSK